MRGRVRTRGQFCAIREAQLFLPLLALALGKLLRHRAEAQGAGWNPVAGPLLDTLGQVTSVTTGLLKAQVQEVFHPWSSWLARF